MPFADRAVGFHYPVSALPIVAGVILELDPAFVPERLQQFGEYFTYPDWVCQLLLDNMNSLLQFIHTQAFRGIFVFEKCSDQSIF